MQAVLTSHARLRAAIRRDRRRRRRLARPRSICATATSPTWALPKRSIARWCWSPTSIAAACSRTSSARWRCLSRERARRVSGFVINRFRGDIALLQPGLDWLERQTGKPVLAVLPYLHGLHLDAEDGISRAAPPAHGASGQVLNVVVPVLPRISNHTDFDPLRAAPAGRPAIHRRRRADRRRPT